MQILMNLNDRIRAWLMKNMHASYQGMNFAMFFHHAERQIEVGKKWRLRFGVTTIAAGLLIVTGFTEEPSLGGVIGFVVIVLPLAYLTYLTQVLLGMWQGLEAEIRLRVQQDPELRKSLIEQDAELQPYLARLAAIEAEEAASRNKDREIRRVEGKLASTLRAVQTEEHPVNRGTLLADAEALKAQLLSLRIK